MEPGSWPSHVTIETLDSRVLCGRRRLLPGDVPPALQGHADSQRRGAFAVLTKPFDLSRLVQLVDQAAA